MPGKIFAVLIFFVYALLEYRTKSSRAREVSGGATEKLERAMATAGIPSS